VKKLTKQTRRFSEGVVKHQRGKGTWGSPVVQKAAKPRIPLLAWGETRKSRGKKGTEKIPGSEKSPRNARKEKGGIISIA